MKGGEDHYECRVNEHTGDAITNKDSLILDVRHSFLPHLHPFLPHLHPFPPHLHPFLPHLRRRARTTHLVCSCSAEWQCKSATATASSCPRAHRCPPKSSSRTCTPTVYVLHEPRWVGWFSFPTWIHDGSPALRMLPSTTYCHIGLYLDT